MMASPLRIFLVCFLAGLAVLPAQRARTPGVGRFTAELDALHPVGRVKRQAERFGWNAAFLKRYRVRDLELKGARLRAVVPESARERKPMGLFVWVSPGDVGQVPHEWLPALDRRRVIVAGADRSGNERKIWDRVSLALAVVHWFESRYRLDPKRVWIGGYSGGGRIASRVAFHYPEVFAGSYTMGGCNWWKEIAVPGSKPRKVWPARFPKPEGSRLRQVQLISRHVFLVGADDFNRDHVWGIYRDARRREGLKHTLYQELPGQGHVWAPAADFQKGLAFLDGEDPKER